MAASESRSVSCARSAAGARGRPRNVTPNALTKQAAASAADSASSAPTAGTRIFRPQGGNCGLSKIAWKVSHSDTKPLSGGKRRNRDAADEKGEGGLRHAADEPAKVLHVALAGCGKHSAGAEEQQALEERMVEDVEQGGRHRQRGGQGHAMRLEGEREAEADEDDADILNRVIGEQPLEVVLHQRVEHAHHCGHAAEGEHEHAPPPGGRRRPGRRRCARSRRPRPWS